MNQRRMGWLGALLAVAGCSLPAPAPAPASAAAGAAGELDGTAWVLEALPGHAWVPDVVPTARFEPGHLAGSDGCNRYSIPYSTQGDTIQLGPQAAATQMACPPAVMDQASAYLAALAAARTWQADAGRLELRGADGAVLARFAPQALGLAGTAWEATGINNGRGAVASVAVGSRVTLVFATDGRASGSAGCNTFISAYRAADSTLRFSPAAATRRACPDPAVMGQEQAYLAALGSVDRFSLEGDRLELRRSDGALALSFVRTQAP